MVHLTPRGGVYRAPGREAEMPVSVDEAGCTPEADLRETPVMRIALRAEHVGPVGRPGADAYPNGQAGAGVLSLAKALAARDHQVTVYSGQDSAALPGRTTVGHGVTVEYMPLQAAA